MVSLFSLLTLGAALYYIASPMRQPFKPEAQLSGDQTGLSVQERDQRERLVQMLKDLQLDYDLGAISKEEYDRTYQSLSLELAPLLEE